MRQARRPTMPYLPQLTFGMLVLGLVLGAILLWSMRR
jgi:hypothetical protein